MAGRREIGSGLVIGESTTFRSREQFSVPSSQLRTGRFASLRISFQREQRREPPAGTMLIFRGMGGLRLRSAAPRFAQDDKLRPGKLDTRIRSRRVRSCDFQFLVI